MEAGTEEGSLEKTQLGLKLEGRVGRGGAERGGASAQGGLLLPDFQSSGLEFSRESCKVLKWFPLQPHQMEALQDQVGMGRKKWVFLG